MSRPVYEKCNLCSGRGWIVTEGVFTTQTCVCQQLRVLPVGVNIEQIDHLKNKVESLEIVKGNLQKQINMLESALTDAHERLEEYPCGECGRFFPASDLSEVRNGNTYCPDCLCEVRGF